MNRYFDININALSLMMTPRKYSINLRNKVTNEGK